MAKQTPIEKVLSIIEKIDSEEEIIAVWTSVKEVCTQKLINHQKLAEEKAEKLQYTIDHITGNNGN